MGRPTKNVTKGQRELRLTVRENIRFLVARRFDARFKSKTAKYQEIERLKLTSESQMSRILDTVDGHSIELDTLATFAEFFNLKPIDLLDPALPTRIGGDDAGDNDGRVLLQRKRNIRTANGS